MKTGGTAPSFLHSFAFGDERNSHLLFCFPSFGLETGRTAISSCFVGFFHWKRAEQPFPSHRTFFKLLSFGNGGTAISFVLQHASSKENINIFAHMICNAFPSAVKCSSPNCSILEEDLFLQVIANFPDNRNFFFASYRPAKFSSKAISNSMTTRRNTMNPPKIFIFQEFMNQVHIAEVLSTKLYSLPRLREKIDSVVSLGEVTVNDPRNPNRLLIAYCFGKTKDRHFSKWHSLTSHYHETWIIPNVIEMGKLRMIQDRSILSVAYKSVIGTTLLPKKDRSSVCFTIAMTDKNTTLEAFKKLDHLAQEVYSHAFAEDQEFQKFCTPIVSTAAHSNLINKKHIAVFAVRALQDDELRAALVLLRNKKLFHFVSRSKLLHLFASPEQVEDLRSECLTQDLKLPFGTKEGTFAIELDQWWAIFNTYPRRTGNELSATSVCSARLIMTLFTQPIKQRRQLYRLLSLGIKEVHFQELSRRCPPRVHRITSLSILPRVFDTHCTTRTLTCHQLTEEWELPHSDTLSDILRELTLAKHADIPSVSWTSFMLTCYRILEFRLNTEPNFPRSINRIYTWNLTSWTPQYPSNKHKNNFIRRALKKGPVLLQETKWTNEHYRHMLHTWPEIPIAHSPAISLQNGHSGGTAILLPPAWSILETVEIVPGYVIAVKAKQAGYLVWFVSMCTQIPLDRHWIQKTLTSTAQTIKGQAAFIGIDCNNVDKTFPELWANFLMQTDLVDIAPELNTYFYQGGSSPLDRILVPSLMVDAAHLHATAYCMHFYDKFGHQPVQGRIQCPPKLAIHPDSIKHETIPTAAFCAPITMHNSAETSIYHASMGRLLRALYDHVDPTSNANASVKATIWTWWRKA